MLKTILARCSLLQFLILTFALSTSYAQRITQLEYLGRNQGLYETDIKKIARDDPGYFYLLSENKLMRYDGEDILSMDDVLIQDKILPSRVDDLNRIEGGEIVLTIPDNNFTYFVPKNQNRLSKIQREGYPIVSDEKLYYVIKDNETYRIEYFESVYDEKGEVIIDNLPSKAKNIFSIDNTIYLQLADNTILHISDEQEKFISPNGQLIKGGNNLYIVNGSGIYVINNNEVTSIFETQNENFRANLINHNKSGQIIVGYSALPRFTNEIIVIDKDLSIHDFSFIANFNDMVRAVYSENYFTSLMLGTYTGAYIINFEREGLSYILNDASKKDGEYGEIITSTISIDNNRLHFTTESAGTSIYNAVDSTITEISDKIPNIFNNLKYYYDENDKYIYGSNYSYDDESYIFRYRADSLQDISKYTIPIKLIDIIKYENDIVLIGGSQIDNSRKGLLVVFDFKSKDYKNIDIENLPTVTAMYKEVDQGRYWIGTEKGLFLFDNEWNQITKFDQFQNEDNYLLYDHTHSINICNDNIVVASNGGGFYIIDRVNLKVKKNIRIEDGLTDNIGAGIIEDDLNLCWLSTYNGLNVIDSTLNIINHFNSYEGLVNAEFNRGSVTKDTFGNLYFGTINGVQIVNPQIAQNTQKTFGISIESVKAYSKNKIYEVENPSDSINIYNTVDSLLIEFNTPDYSKYSNFNENIIAESDDPNIDLVFKDNRLVLKNFSNDRFKIYFRRSYQGESVSTLDIIRLRDRSSLARILSILGMFVLSTLILVRIITRYNQKKEEAKTEMNSRIANMRLTALQAQMNPHFIFNSLGAIQYYIQIEDIDMADSYLGDFASLMRKILDSSKEKLIKLQDEIDTLQLYLKLEKLRFEEKFNYKIQVDVNVERSAYIPPMILQPFVENAINHGLYNLTNRQGLLQIEFTVDKDDLLCIIEDNGIGREKAKIMRKKKHIPRSMQVTDQRLATLNEYGNINIDIEVEDLYNKDINSGTKVIVRIKNYLYIKIES